MTRSLSTLLLLLACFNCEAQKISFTDTSNMWALYSFDIGTLQNDTITYQKYFGETIINGITYFNLENWDVRPDSTGDIIFARTGTGTEFILYDFSLNLGDTIHTSVWGTYHHIVTAIDSVFLNNYWHKVWHFGAYYDSPQPTAPYYVIEGIGSNRGPLFPIMPVLAQRESRLYCFSNDDGQPTITPAAEWFDNFNSCLLNVGKLSFANNIEVYPVPAHGKLFIDLPKHANANSIELIDIVGREIIRTNYLNDQNKYQFDVSNVQAGIYLIRINTNLGVLTKKIEIF